MHAPEAKAVQGLKHTLQSSSIIQTLLSALEFHQIGRALACARFAGCTAGREFHPAPKNYLYSFYRLIIQQRFYDVNRYIKIFNDSSNPVLWNNYTTVTTV